MHNGGIADFYKIKRKLQSSLPDELFNMVNGNTGRSCDHLGYYVHRLKLDRFAMGIRPLALEGTRFADRTVLDP